MENPDFRFFLYFPELGSECVFLKCWQYSESSVVTHFFWQMWRTMTALLIMHW